MSEQIFKEESNPEYGIEEINATLEEPEEMVEVSEDQVENELECPVCYEMCRPPRYKFNHPIIPAFSTKKTIHFKIMNWICLYSEFQGVRTATSSVPSVKVVFASSCALYAGQTLYLHAPSLLRRCLS